MSSGNLTADRRFAYAVMLRRDGEVEAAADVFAQTLELVPTWAEGHFALAEALGEAGQKDKAVAAYRAYLQLDPADSMGAAVKLALLGVESAAALPEAYVRRLFDEYAPRFDTALVDKLKYRGPQILRAGVDRVQPKGIFTAVFDLGCGTGLAGEAFRARAAWLGGVDLSPGMVREAERKNVYDQLEAGDMVAALKTLATPCDLILAADVLTYFGDLTDVFAAVRQKLNGLFAFTVQRHDGEGFKLGAEHRFNHSEPYIAALAEKIGFKVMLIEAAVTRREKDADVPGLVVVLT